MPQLAHPLRPDSDKSKKGLVLSKGTALAAVPSGRQAAAAGILRSGHVGYRRMLSCPSMLDYKSPSVPRWALEMQVLAGYCKVGRALLAYAGLTKLRLADALHEKARNSI